MSNSDLADIFKLYADLSELHGGNAFKIKSFASASFRIDKMTEPLFGKSVQELENIEGIGKSIAQKIDEIYKTGGFKELQELIDATPEGVRDIMRIKGIGPKKVAMIWKEMGVESVGELLYACKENRLAQYKGFGLKTQESVSKQIEFIYASASFFHYAKVYQPSNDLLAELRNLECVDRVEICGELRRKLEVLQSLDYLIETDDEASLRDELATCEWLEEIETGYVFAGYPVHIFTSNKENFAQQWFELSSAEAHRDKVLSAISVKTSFAEETEIYDSAGLPFMEPELRENNGEFERAAKGSLPQLITYSDLKGPLHNHSTWSDGLHTIETMANWCLDKGYSYLGMADHSKSAFYANGLSEEHVFKQQEEIAKLNQGFGDRFKIFAGIECDILYDGKLDYESDILKTFDYVVASVHSVLKMTEEKAMSRLISAIENPYTTILGHPTGRLLLMREGYPINHQKMIDACAANGVILELNANPYRLDIDWRWIDYALNKGVSISINPDAHEVNGFLDMFYGIEVARKGFLSKEMCFIAQSKEFLIAHFAKRQG